ERCWKSAYLDSRDPEQSHNRTRVQPGLHRDGELFRSLSPAHQQQRHLGFEQPRRRHSELRWSCNFPAARFDYDHSDPGSIYRQFDADRRAAAVAGHYGYAEQLGYLSRLNVAADRDGQLLG